MSRLHEIGARERDEIERVWPRVMRRVGGYNLDVFHPQSERPYTADGSVNLSHLLVGSEGTLAVFRRLHLKLSPLPAARVLGVVNFPDFHAAMASAQLGRTAGSSFARRDMLKVTAVDDTRPPTKPVTITFPRKDGPQ